MNCEVCNKNTITKASIITDYYYKSICNSCYTRLTHFKDPSSALATYDRSRDAEDHEAYMIQPYSGGKISAEFIHLYPERAKQMFTPKEIDAATRS